MQFIVHVENIVPVVMFIDKLNVKLSFQHLKYVDIVFLYNFQKSFFRKAIFSVSIISHSPFLASKNFLYPSFYVQFWEALSP